MGYSFLLLVVIGVVAALFSLIYKFFTISLYNKLIYVLILLTIIIMVAVVAAMLAIFIAVKWKKTNSVLLISVRLGLKLVMPFALFVADVLKRDKDVVRSLFVDLNNMFVQSCGIRKKSDKILLLLPHCLQNSECKIKLTGNIRNCKKCGRCTIGAILEMVEETGIKAMVVTGGTAARNIIAREKPEMILAVACERDLSIGISDVDSIPVLGVLNKRPNGPCINTTVDVDLLREKLNSIIEPQSQELQP